jgi:hypothetical protein
LKIKQLTKPKLQEKQIQRSAFLQVSIRVSTGSLVAKLAEDSAESGFIVGYYRAKNRAATHNTTALFESMKTKTLL